jgi:hypothetical protein
VSLFALLLSAALLASPAPRTTVVNAQAGTITTNETVALSTTTVNLCDADTVTLSGSLHIVTHFTTDSNGGTHTSSHQNFENVSGTGTTSVTYRAVSSNNHTVNDNGGNSQQEFTIINRVRLITQGATGNYLLNITINTTINASGVATSTVNSVAANCTG